MELTILEKRTFLFGAVHILRRMRQHCHEDTGGIGLLSERYHSVHLVTSWNPGPTLPQ